MKEFTPGPWKKLRVSDEMIVIGTDCYDVCRLYHGETKKPYPNSAENANLLVAAPDMLEALEALISLCRDDLETHLGGPVAGMIVRAVDKARGKS